MLFVHILSRIFINKEISRIINNHIYKSFTKKTYDVSYEYTR